MSPHFNFELEDVSDNFIQILQVVLSHRCDGCRGFLASFEAFGVALKEECPHCGTPTIGICFAVDPTVTCGHESLHVGDKGRHVLL